MRLATLILLAAAGASASGLTFHSNTNGKKSVAYLDGNHIRVDTEGGTAMIFDASSNTIIRLDDAKKTFSETTAEEMAAGSSKAMEQMKASLGKMPPEQRKAIEAQMAKITNPTKVDTKWSRTGKDETIAGLACKGYKGTTASGPTESCFVPWGHGISKEDLAPMIAFSNTMRAALGIARGSSQVIEDFQRAPGFPAAQIIYDESGGKRVETRLESLSRGSIPASRFVVPPGYTQHFRSPKQ